MNKTFAELTQQEIDQMSDADFKAVSPFDKKSCFDCANLKSAMHWWCTSPEAREARGTSLPGCIKCRFWKPEWEMIDAKYRTSENGYKPQTETIQKSISKKWYHPFLTLFK